MDVIGISEACWYEWMFNHISQHTPRRTQKRQNLQSWVKPDTLHYLNKVSYYKSFLRRKIKPSEDQLQKLKSMTDHCETRQTNDRIVYEENLSKGRNQKAIFKYLKSLKRDKFPPTICYKSFVAKSDSEKAIFLNCFFSTIVQDPNYVSFHPSEYTIFGNIKVSFGIEDIRNELDQLKVNKSRGADELPPVLLKSTSPVLSKSLFAVFQNIKRLKKFPVA